MSAGIFTNLFAAATADVSVGVRPGHNVAPERVTNLLAATGASDGRIELSWTAPQTTWNIKVRDYYIRWSSSSVNDAPFTGDTTAWWNASGGQDLYDWMNDPGENVNLTVNGLTPAVTYYFAIKAEDEFDNLSSFDIKTQALNQANATAGLDSTAPGSIVNLTALTGDNEGEVKLAWTAPGDDGITGQLTANLPPNFTPYVYEMKVSDFSLAPYGGSADAWWTMAPTVKTVLISTAQIPGTKQTLVITGLTPGAKLWFGIKAYD
ncbi:fibronectin type III domain-containing protein, partial [bacterium]|nr:fibronectin type III domain-containing protein [bacterium]